MDGIGGSNASLPVWRSRLPLLYGKRMTILTIVVAIGFLGCWYFLRAIRNYTLGCSHRLMQLDSTATDINISLGSIYDALDNLKDHIEERFPVTRLPPDDPLE